MTRGQGAGEPAAGPRPPAEARGGHRFHVTRDEEYLKLLKAEEEFWDTTPFHIVESDRPLPGPLWRYTNEQLTGDSGTEWFQTVSRYGTFRRGCVIGTGNTTNEGKILKDNPSLHLSFFDISGEALSRREARLGAQFPGRVATEQVDLNFIELPREQYDVVISDSCMHHILNLEHIAAEINEALVPGGYFFYHDYVGEARLQFSEEKKRFLEAFFQWARGRYRILRNWHVVWSDLDDWQHSPLEAIRSDETLEIFRRYLVEVWRGTTWPIVIPWLFAKRRRGGRRSPGRGPWWRRRLRPIKAGVQRVPEDYPYVTSGQQWRRLLKDVVMVDRVLSESGLFRPCHGFAVYRKRAPGDPDVAHQQVPPGRM